MAVCHWLCQCLRWNLSPDGALWQTMDRRHNPLLPTTPRNIKETQSTGEASGTQCHSVSSVPPARPTSWIATCGSLFLVIHPFREGNARTIKLMTNLLAVQTGRPLLLYDARDEGQRLYVEAARAAFKKNYAPLASITGGALERARREQNPDAPGSAAALPR